jgi:hypothetical protein
MFSQATVAAFKAAYGPRQGLDLYALLTEVEGKLGRRLAAGSLGVERGKHTTSDVHGRFIGWLGTYLRWSLRETVLANA